MADIYCIFKNFEVLKKYYYFVNFLNLFKFGHLGRSVIWDVGHLGLHLCLLLHIDCSSKTYVVVALPKKGSFLLLCGFEQNELVESCKICGSSEHRTKKCPKKGVSASANAQHVGNC